MKKTINNRKYNTETAKKLGEWENVLDVTDFHYYSEALYLKRNGEFFLHGTGNALSKYATSEGNNSWSGGSEIIPLTYEAAREWAEKHLDVEDYEAVFGEVSVDGDNEAVISVRVSAASKVILDRYCAQHGAKKGDVINRLISTLLEDEYL